MPAPFDHPDWQQIEECDRVLKNAGSNPVWEILRQSSPFVQWDHYPKGDVFDKKTHSQYFYHAHPRINPHSQVCFEENGHFHLFIRKAGVPPEIQPIEIDRTDRPKGSKEDDICHIIAISMDKQGAATRLFTTNRWVTGEMWYQASDVVKLIDYFNMDHAYPSWPLNLWLSSLVRVYRNEILSLVEERDRVIAAWKQQHPDRNVYEDRQLEITSVYEIPHPPHAESHLKLKLPSSAQ